MSADKREAIAAIIADKAISMAANRGGPRYERGTEADVKEILRLTAKKIAVAGR